MCWLLLAISTQRTVLIITGYMYTTDCADYYWLYLHNGLCWLLLAISTQWTVLIITGYIYTMDCAAPAGQDGRRIVLRPLARATNISLLPSFRSAPESFPGSKAVRVRSSPPNSSAQVTSEASYNPLPQMPSWRSRRKLYLTNRHMYLTNRHSTLTRYLSDRHTYLTHRHTYLNTIPY